jgi:hypothetical protein
MVIPFVLNIILKAITDINAGNIELQNQIDSDKFDLQEREFEVILRVCESRVYPLKNYHKEWYDFEADSVMICRDK